MRMIYLTQYFSGPSQPGSGRPWQTVSFFGNRGHRVKLIVSDLDYTTGMPRQEGIPDQDKLPPSVSLHVVPAFGFGKSMLSRAIQYVCYTLFALVKGLFFQKIDVVLASSPPLFVGVAGYFLAVVKRAKFVLEIRDPWPDAPVYFGVLKNPVIIWALLKIEKFLYNRAHLIVPVTPGMKRHIQTKGIPGTKIKVITTGYDQEMFADCPAPRWPDRGKALVLYTGSLGVINEPVLLMEVVELLKEHPDIKFHFIGSGISKPLMQQIAAEKGLSNVNFSPPVARKELKRYFSEAQLSIVATRPGFYSEVGLHNKMFDYMGVGLPVVISGTGDIKHIIEASGGGIVVEPGNPRTFAAAVLYLAYRPELCAVMGRRGKEYINAHFNRAKLLADYEEAILQLLAGSSGGTRQKRPAEG